MTLTNPGLESLKAGGPLSEDLFAGDAPVSSVSGRVLLPGLTSNLWSHVWAK